MKDSSVVWRAFAATALIAFVVISVLMSITAAPAKGHDGVLPAVKICLSSTCTTGHGTGFQLYDGYFVTAAHVVGARKTMWLKNSDGQVQEATVIWTAAGSDYALVHTDGADFLGLPETSLGCDAPLEVGDKITNIGNPADLFFTRVSGYVAAGPQDFGPWKGAVPVVLPVYNGSSGGPIFDSANRIVGIIVGGIRATEFVAMEPITKICDFLPTRKAVPVEVADM